MAIHCQSVQPVHWLYFTWPQLYNNQSAWVLRLALRQWFSCAISQTLLPTQLVQWLRGNKGYLRRGFLSINYVGNKRLIQKPKIWMDDIRCNEICSWGVPHLSPQQQVCLSLPVDHTHLLYTHTCESSVLNKLCPIACPFLKKQRKFSFDKQRPSEGFALSPQISFTLSQRGIASLLLDHCSKNSCA